jgi:hypothetical protein
MPNRDHQIELASGEGSQISTGILTCGQAYLRYVGSVKVSKKYWISASVLLVIIILSRRAVWPKSSMASFKSSNISSTISWYAGSLSIRAAIINNLSIQEDGHLPRSKYSYANFAMLYITLNIQGASTFRIFISLETISSDTIFVKGKIRYTRVKTSKTIWSYFS